MKGSFYSDSCVTCSLLADVVRGAQLVMLAVHQADVSQAADQFPDVRVPCPGEAGHVNVEDVVPGVEQPRRLPGLTPRLGSGGNITEDTGVPGVEL